VSEKPKEITSSKENLMIPSKVSTQTIPAHLQLKSIKQAGKMDLK